MMTRYVHAIFCDDIRQEMGGKLSLIGVYTGECLVPSIPCVLPKLAFSLALCALKENPFKAIEVKAVFGGMEVVNMSLDEAQIQEIMGPSAAAPSTAKRMMISLFGVMSPFNVSAEGRLSVVVTADGEELGTEHLDIKLATNS